jgi:hypothetical protein
LDLYIYDLSSSFIFQLERVVVVNFGCMPNFGPPFWGQFLSRLAGLKEVYFFNIDLGCQVSLPERAELGLMPVP